MKQLVKIFWVSAAFYFLCCPKTLSQDKIVYDLPKTVTQNIDSFAANYPDTTKFSVLFSKSDSNRYTVSVNPRDYSQSEGARLIDDILINKTNRFIRLGNGKLLPMITWDDIQFADFGTTYNPNSPSEKRRVGKKRVVMNNDGWSITFDVKGNIFTEKTILHFVECNGKNYTMFLQKEGLSSTTRQDYPEGFFVAIAYADSSYMQIHCGGSVSRPLLRADKYVLQRESQIDGVHHREGFVKETNLAWREDYHPAKRVTLCYVNVKTENKVSFDKMFATFAIQNP